MKKLLLILLFVPIVAFGQTEKLKETLIKKSIKWTEVASTGRNYEEAKKYLMPNMDSSTFSSNSIRSIIKCRRASVNFGTWSM